MSQFVIRPVDETDARALWQVIQTAFAEYRDKLEPPSGVFTETVEDIQHKIRDGGGFIATFKDKIAGGVVYQPKQDYLYLGRLAVLPNFRGQGLSRGLVEAVEKQAQRQDLPKVRVGVRGVLTGNQAMFTHLGYRVVSHETHPGYSEPTFLYMDKDILFG